MVFFGGTGTEGRKMSRGGLGVFCVDGEGPLGVVREMDLLTFWGKQPGGGRQMDVAIGRPGTRGSWSGKGGGIEGRENWRRRGGWRV